jgi:hypothetical protein
MTVDTNEHLDRYAHRGTPRGANNVLSAAQADAASGPSYISPHDEAPRRRSRAAIAAMAAVIAIAGGTLVRNGTTSSSTVADQPTGVSTTQPPTPEELAAASAQLAQNQAKGWVPFGNSLPNGQHVDGWIRWKNDAVTGGVTGDADQPANQQGAPRTAVYDKPDGTIIAYYYLGAGVFDVATANSPTFNPEEARRANDICDPGPGGYQGGQTPEYQACIEAHRQAAAANTGK